MSRTKVRRQRGPELHTEWHTERQVKRLPSVRAVAFAVSLAAAISALPACGWEDHSAGGDMPWMGNGGRARIYSKDASCFGCPTGYKHEERWGSSSWSGEDPYVTVGKAMNFLFTDGGMAKAAKRFGAGSVADDSGVIEPRALPYHMTVVMIKPTVIVMNFDLGALVRDGETREGQVIGTPYTDGYLNYGTRVPATGSLLWFSPDAKVAPTPVAGQASGHAEIAVSGHRIALDRKDFEWVATRK
jgi:hypothetical protein